MEKLSFLIEQLIDSLNEEEKRYILQGELKELTATELKYLDLIYHSESLNVGDLAKKLKVSKPSATVFVDKMEKKGWLLKEAFADDKRITLISLTEKGMKLAKNHEQFHLHYARQITKKLENKQIDRFIEILSNMFE